MPINSPTHEEIETAAYYCWEHGDKGAGHDSEDWSQSEQLVFLAKNYDVISNYELRSRKKQFIGENKNRRCRYCGKTPPNVNAG